MSLNKSLIYDCQELDCGDRADSLQSASCSLIFTEHSFTCWDENTGLSLRFQLLKIFRLTVRSVRFLLIRMLLFLQTTFSSSSHLSLHRHKPEQQPFHKKPEKLSHLVIPRPLRWAFFNLGVFRIDLEDVDSACIACRTSTRPPFWRGRPDRAS